MIKPHKLDEDMAARVKLVRENRGLSLAALAKLAECSIGTLSEIESGHRAHPSYIVLARIADALGTTHDYLRLGGAVDDAEDRAFFNRYRTLDARTKRKVRGALDIIAGDLVIGPGHGVTKRRGIKP